MAALLARISSAGSGGTPTGLHGTNIVETKALPSGKTLSESQQNTVNGVSTNLAFAVTVQDSGNFQEAGIKVTLTIQQKSPIVKTQTIQLINPGQTKTLTFSNLGEVTVRDPGARERRREAGPRRDEDRQQQGQLPGPVLTGVTGARLGGSSARRGARRGRRRCDLARARAGGVP